MKKLIKLPSFLFALMAIFFVFGFASINYVQAADKININTANATELDAIPEVGPATAAKIIDYREVNGPFLVIEDIMKVSGIKQTTFDKMKDYIVVSDPVIVDPPIIPPTSTTTSTTTPIATTTTMLATTTNAYSVHCVQEDLSSYTEPTNIFEVSAGRERLAYINSPVSFIAKHRVSSDVSSHSCDYLWSFGDGVAKEGEKMEHVYKYSGDYNVVLNGTCAGLQSVSRTKVKVVTPDLVMFKNIDGSILISNSGKYEINLYNWEIQSSSQTYVFPIDTIISAGQSVTFPAEYLGLSTTGMIVTLLDASGKMITQAGASNFALNTDTSISQADIEKYVTEYQRLVE